jgi:hypothetical protein
LTAKKAGKFLLTNGSYCALKIKTGLKARVFQQPPHELPAQKGFKPFPSSHYTLSGLSAAGFNIVWICAKRPVLDPPNPP